MSRDDRTGVWSVDRRRATGTGKYYRYRVTVWQPAAQKVVTASVTDPYSLALSADSTHSQIVDLADPALAPAGWSALRKPAAVTRRRSRSRSCRSATSPSPTPPCRPPSAAPTRPSPTRTRPGMKHLTALADAGRHARAPAAGLRLRHHPGEAGRPEAARLRPGRRCRRTPTEQQECVAAVAADGRLQLGLRPAALHDPGGRLRDRPGRRGRTVEFRQMVAGLNQRRPARGHGRRLQPHLGGRHRPASRCSTRSCPATTSGCSPTARSPTRPAAPTPRPRTP